MKPKYLSPTINQLNKPATKQQATSNKINQQQ
jgi:hypothetical protein